MQSLQPNVTHYRNLCCLLILSAFSFHASFGQNQDHTKEVASGKRAASGVPAVSQLPVILGSGLVSSGPAASGNDINFIQNKGQWPSHVLYRADVAGGQMLATPDGMLVGKYDQAGLKALSDYLLEKEQESRHKKVKSNGKLIGAPFIPGLKGHGWKFNFIGGKMAAPNSIDAKNESVGYYNYLSATGSNATTVHSYSDLTYNDVYPGIDVRYYTSAEGSLENDIIIKPGANAEQIILKIDGINGLHLGSQGELILPSTVGDIVIPHPISYLKADQVSGENSLVADQPVSLNVKYEVINANTIRFNIPVYDRHKTLVIDPIVMRWATMVSNNTDIQGHCHGIDLDAAGNIYVTGNYGDGLITVGPFETLSNFGVHIFIGKYMEPATPGGAGSRIWQTYLGGESTDNPYSLVVGPDGYPYITGLTTNSLNTTYGTGFSAGSWTQRTASAFGATTQQGFIARINPSGTGALVREIGGVTNDFTPLFYDIRILPTGTNTFDLIDIGDVIQESYSADGDIPAAQLPDGTQNASDLGYYNGYALRITNDLSNIVWARQYSSSGAADDEFSISSIDNSNNIYIGGLTGGSGGISYNNPSSQNSLEGAQDGWLMALNPGDGSAQWSRYFNSSVGSSSVILCMQTNEEKSQLDIGGITGGLDAANITTGSYSTTYNGGFNDLFVASIPTTGASTTWGTYFGGNDNESNMMGLNVDQNDDVFVLAYSLSKNIPVATDPVQDNNYDPINSDAIFFELSPNGKNLLYSTYLGGASDETDPVGETGIKFNNCRVYLAITSESADFPLTAGTLTSTKLSQVGLTEPFVVSMANPPDFSGNSIISGGDQTLLCGQRPDSIVGGTPSYSIASIIRNNVPESNSTVNAYPDGLPTITSYQWQGSLDSGNTWITLTGATGKNFQPGQTIGSGLILYRRIANGDACTRPTDTSDVAYIHINLPPGPVATNSSPVCLGQTVQLTASNIGASGYVWSGPDNYVSYQQNDSVLNVTFSNAGVYSVVGIEKSSGCTTAPGTTTVVINPKPVANAGAGATECQNGKVTLGGSPTASGGTEPYTYAWSPGSGLNNSTNPNPVASPGSTTTYKLVVTDSSGCSATASTTVNVDTVLPKAVCKGATLVLDSNGNATLIPANVDGGSTDSCGKVSLSLSKTSFNCSNIGLNQVMLTATDSAGNISTCSASVNVVDNTPPKAVCKSISVSLSGDSVSITGSEVDGGSTDNCGIVSRTVTPSTFNCSNLGANTVVLTVTDASGNSSTCSATVTVSDTTPPVAICKNDTVALVNGSASITAADVNGGSTDNCSIVSSTVAPSTFNCTNIGSNAVVLTVTDASGNTSTCAATVIVTGDLTPTAICKNDTVYLNTSGNARITASSVDGGSHGACGESITSSVSPSTFTCSNMGSNSVILTVSDSKGNSASCGATVTVIDNTPPVAVCKNDTVALVDDSASITATDVNGGSTDNCSIVFSTVTPSTFNCTNIGSNAVVLTVTDASGNTSTCSATVVVTGDLTPTAICKNDTVYVDASGNASITASSVDGGSHGACGESITSSVSPSTFTCANTGSNSVILTVSDSKGNTASCGATVTVLDNTPPVAVCKNDTVALVDDSASITATDVNGGSTDNCSIVSSTVTPSTFNCTNIGSNAVVLTVTDASGNTSTCSATVVVTGDLTPTAICKNDTVYLNTSGNARITASSVDGGSHGACGESITSSVSPSTFTCSNMGSNSVILTVSDSKGNTASCGATVTVLDNTPPVAVCKNDTVALVNDSASITATDVNGGSTDNCSIVSSTVTPSTFNCTNIGSNAVVLTVTDASGNTSTCSATVVVTGDLTPTAICKSDTVYLNASGNAGITASSVDGGSHGACGESITSSVSPSTFTCANTGSNSVILTVSDSKGNTASCGATVTVIDNTPPVAVCKNDTVALVNGSVSIIPANVDGGSTDNCGIVSRIAAPSAFDCTNIGPNQVILTVTDASGNSSTCEATVVVTGDLTPTAICKNDTVYIDASGSASITASSVDGGSHGACGESITNSISPSTFTCTNVGSNSVILTVSDSKGNTASCGATVTVLNSTPPVAVCKNDTVALVDGSASITDADVNGGSTDNCSIISSTVTPSTFNCTNIGSNAVVLTVTDASGNTSTCTATVVVTGDLTPTAICKNDTVYLNASGNASITASSVDGGSHGACGESITSSVSPSTFTCANTGSNSVILTVKDAKGNTASCSATVTVLDNTPPVAVCKNDTVTLVNGLATIVPLDVDGGSTDNCAVASRSISVDSFTIVNVGNNNVTLIVTDASGNTSSCVAVVTVLGKTCEPFICSITSVPGSNCGLTGLDDPNIIYLGYGPQSTTLSVNLTGDTGPFTYVWSPSDNLSCTGCSDPVFTPTAQGNYTFTVTITSKGGCTSTCTISICVLDIRVPACNGGNNNGGSCNNGNGSGGNCSGGNNNGGGSCNNGGSSGNNNGGSCNNGNGGNSGGSGNNGSGGSCNSGSGNGGGSGSGCNAPHKDDVCGSGNSNSNGNNNSGSCNGNNSGCNNNGGSCGNNGSNGGNCNNGDNGGSCNGGGCNNSNCCNDGNSLVYICHTASGCNSSPQTISVSISDVQSYLQRYPNDHLGSCGQSCSCLHKDDDIARYVPGDNSNSFDVFIYPNPFRNQFHIRIETQNDDPIEIRMYNLAGQIVLYRTNVQVNEDIYLGNTIATGLYYMEVLQGDSRKVLRVDKSQ